MATIPEQAASSIIHEQEAIIGPIAWMRAERVSGLQVDRNKGEVRIDGRPDEVLGELVSQYQALFGRASIEVCRDAVRPIAARFSKGELPQILR